MILNISPFVKLKMLSEQVVVKIRDFMNCVPRPVSGTVRASATTTK